MATRPKRPERLSVRRYKDPAAMPGFLLAGTPRPNRCPVRALMFTVPCRAGRPSMCLGGSRMTGEAGVRYGFMRAAMSAPFLEREEEMNLAWRWRRDHDEVALHRLAAAHMRLVISIASRFRHYGLSMADLVQ